MKTPRRDNDVQSNNPDRNPDPITGTPGAHPVGTGVGAAGAGAAGAAIGAVAGPAGAAIGAVVGAVAGGLVGKGVAEAVNPTEEENYWKENYKTRPYIEEDWTFEEYAPAYRYGWESCATNPGKSFDDVEPKLESEWERTKGQSKLTWDKARAATRDAWDRARMRQASSRPGDERREMDRPE
jgi:hypothetical protein